VNVVGQLKLLLFFAVCGPKFTKNKETTPCPKISDTPSFKHT